MHHPNAPSAESELLARHLAHRKEVSCELDSAFCVETLAREGNDGQESRLDHT